MAITGEDRVFTITELRRVGAGFGVSYQPTGVSFRWTAAGQSAPLAPWSFGVSQRTSRVDYPGSEEPSEQALGWHYEPFMLRGKWDDRYNAPGYALATWREFEALIKRGGLVRLEFEQITITGVITNASFDYRRADMISYQLRFSPHFRAQGETVRATIPGQTRRANEDPRAVAKRARAARDALAASNALAKAENLARTQGALTKDTYTRVLDSLTEITSYLAQAERVIEGQILQLTGTEVSRAFGRVAQLYAQMRDTSNALAVRLRAEDATTITLTSAAAVLDFETWRRGVCSDARRCAAVSEGARRETQARASARVQALHRAREGESLYAISTTYYGSPHNWRAIAQTNGITSLILDGGELLVIPETV